MRWNSWIHNLTIPRLSSLNIDVNRERLED